ATHDLQDDVRDPRSEILGARRDRLICHGPMDYLRASRHTMTARPAATTKAIPLAHTGMPTPLTVTSQPRTNRNNCITAISEKRTTAIRVKGLFIVRSPFRCASVHSGNHSDWRPA